MNTKINPEERKEILAEYSALRDEIIKRIDIRHNIVIFTLIFAGTFLTLSTQIIEQSTLLLLFYPILATFLAALWAHSDIRVSQIGEYIRNNIEAKLEERGTVEDIKFGFWGGMSDDEVNWQYNKEGNHYLRFNGGVGHKDHNNDEQLKAKVVVIQCIKEEGPVDKEKHIFYNPIGEGKAIVFQDGQATEVIWRKKDRESRTFFDSKDKEIKFNRGPIWIEVIPQANKVEY